MKFISYFYGGCFLTMVASGYSVLLQVGGPVGWEKKIMGPFGALLLSVVGLYLAGKFIHRLMQRNKILEDEIKDLLRQRILELELMQKK